MSRIKISDLPVLLDMTQSQARGIFGGNFPGIMASPDGRMFDASHPPPRQPTNQAADPRLEFGQLHDFGDIDLGETVAHVFEFRNAGDTPLKIENVRPSCGCTTSTDSRP